MSVSGDVEIELLDGGGSAVSVASSSLQAVIGVATGGTASAASVVATRSVRTLTEAFGVGELVEAAALTISKGGTVLALRAAEVTAGSIRGEDASPLAVSTVTNATPAVVTTPTHGLATGAVVTISGVTGSTGVNGTWRVTVLSPTTFSVPVAAGGAYVSGGSVQPEGPSSTGAGTGIPIPSGDPLDTYYVEIEVTKAGTIGTAGAQFTVSLDAGRTHGAAVVLGTALTYEIPGTGITLTFPTGKTLVLGDKLRFGTEGPTTNVAGITACIDALAASQYGVIGWGAGTLILGEWEGADASDFDDALDELFEDSHISTRAKISARDLSPPVRWGGTGETEAVWSAAIIDDFSDVDGPRVQCGAGHYNITSQIPTSVAGQPRYRRPLIWAEAARQVTIPPQRHSGRVRDGALSLSINPSTDPIDGFIYHDERVNPGLDAKKGGAGRFTTARSRVGKSGMFISNPLTLAQIGSDYQLYPRGAVADVACSIIFQLGQDEIGDDTRANANGSLYEVDARRIESVLDQALQAQMVAKSMISDESVSVDRDNNVLETEEVNVAVEIRGKAYILQLNVKLGYQHATE